MAEILLIRHFATRGNQEGRYIGVTDEPIVLEEAPKKAKPLDQTVGWVFVSPMLRCRQTASLLFPTAKQKIVSRFRECDFGEFENHNYRELSANPNYQKWVDSQGELPFPGGEDAKEFRKRCRLGFEEAVQWQLRSKLERCAMVVHGGTIMSILEAYGLPVKTFYDWQVKNGEGFLLQLEETIWQRDRKVRVIGRL